METPGPITGSLDERRNDLVSALSEKTAQPFSAFKTPYINTSRWNHIDKLGDVFGAHKFANEKEYGYEDFAERGISDTYDTYYEPYPAWSVDTAPITRDKIQSIFIHISKIFGFQYDNTKNMYDYLMKLLDSRASRMGPVKALRSVHADYIGGYNSNYRKWYFASQMDIEDHMISVNPSFYQLSSKERRKQFASANISLKESQKNWAETTNSFLAEDCIIQLAIYLLIWGEANNLRFMPECICFIFKACVDSFYSLDFTNEIQSLTHSFLDHAITPLYNYYKDQLYVFKNDTWVARDKDHKNIIGYDDLNQSFWYRKSLEKLELYDKSKFLDYQPYERYLYLNQINWEKSVHKTYFETRSWFHVLLDFNRNRRFLPSLYFTNSIYTLKGKKALASLGLWGGVFVSKFTESYFFLTLSIRDPVRELSIIKVDRCIGEEWFGPVLCQLESKIILGLLFATNLVLFFLDTYLWYIIWNTAFSVARSFYCGVSIWTPWRNMFFRLPHRILSKVLNQNFVKQNEINKKITVMKVWNSIVIAMYREHVINIDNLEYLIYHGDLSEEKSDTITEPSFFIQQEDGDSSSSNGDHLKSDSEAMRRLSFFAHSLSTSIAPAMPLEKMPSFSVLVPHYAEKIMLSLQEIIRREEEYSNITLLEYLKHLYPDEWHNFVKDTKIMASEDYDDEKNEKDMNDVPFYTVGFKSATPEYILRTRVWSSLRSQTLYRTISGFMNYSRAIKLLHSAECSDSKLDDVVNVERANVIAQRKFRLVASLQRMKEFNAEQQHAKEYLMRVYPELQVAYLDVETDETTGLLVYYSCLIDGHSDIDFNGERKPKYRIRLSGKPILGDGKSDNQNHAIIFCRGEYVQLIDANQDNYLEECLKIRSVLNEFEEYETPIDPYTFDPYDMSTSPDSQHPVAILGTREYIFSENIGVLGDIAAGKEQTFGTLFARTLAQVGGKLHYGHPDFLNTIFMTTRGGVSKSQRGLHLNEDIYADPRKPTGCTNLIPIINWVERCILSIFLVFGISFIPLCVQELLERGVWRCIYRIFRHFTSLSPMFEVFVCRVYSQSLVNDLAIGGAKYIATGRGFATTRIHFSSLYARFSYESFYFAGTMFMLLLYISMELWRFSLLYFWVTVSALFFSPFWFNPNAFNFTEFFMDYKCFITWLTSGNVRSKRNSWISHIRNTRMTITGSKTKKSKHDTTFAGSNYQRPSLISSFLAQTGSKISTTTLVVIAYLFANSQNLSRNTTASNSLLRLLVVAFGPIAINGAILIVFFVVSVTIGPLVSCCSNSFPGMIANIVHLLSVFVYMSSFAFLMLCQNWDIAKSILGACASYNLQELFFKLVTILLLDREIKEEKSNRAWWSGAWLTSGLGWHVFTQPFREFICKVIEMSYFALDFLIAHFILLLQLPLLCIPYIDTLHSMLLLWLSPQKMLKKPIYSIAKRRMRMRTTMFYMVLFLFNVFAVSSVVVVPLTMAKVMNVDFDSYMPNFITYLFQPIEATVNKRTGLTNYIPPKLHN
ncbi:hypothetical protein CANINC_002412 [Pichia inconspicua]|uniref:1,3-beta-glucan synthase n=1 Tax=Pichia inconspicua TaxID=52247 RepID=A0A4T0X1L7_9ASCO|nr:hypothetical protein CANINC_002412 [[Candida] inconspicua]